MLVGLLIAGGVGVALLLVSFIAGDLLDGALEGFGNDAITGLGLAAFLGAFGFGGALILNATGSTLGAIAGGLAAGAGLGAGATAVTKFLMKGGDEGTVRSANLVGLTGTVVETIPPWGFGQVNVVASGHITKLNARCDEELKPGASVVVTEVLSPTSIKVTRA